VRKNGDKLAEVETLINWEVSGLYVEQIQGVSGGFSNQASNYFWKI
jgi:hypothetical protein